MSLRWDDHKQTLDIGVGDLITTERVHLERSTAFSYKARLEAGVEVHRQVQAESSLSAEVTLRHRLVLREWTITLHGRVDGLGQEEDRWIVEEIKSTALPEQLLSQITRFEPWERQLSIYLWMLVAAQRPHPIGRLRVVSLVDGAMRIFQLLPDPKIEAEILTLLDDWILRRQRRNAWMAHRRSRLLPFAHLHKRPGQIPLIEQVETSLLGGKHLLLSAPTGIGKTAAILEAALKVARAKDLQVVWVTARTTQRIGVLKTLQMIRERGGEGLRAVILASKERLCLNDLIDCRSESCVFARDYFAKLRQRDVLEQLPDLVEAESLKSCGQQHTLCPHALALDRAEDVDLIVGDYNHLFDLDAEIKRLALDRCIVVVDEAHQLPDRVGEAASPRLYLEKVQAVLKAYDAPEHQALIALAQRVGREIQDAPLRGTGEGDTQEVVVELSLRTWQSIRDAFDEVAWDHLRLRPLPEHAALPGASAVLWPDPWIELARSVYRFVRSLELAGDETVALAGRSQNFSENQTEADQLRLLCRDPSAQLGPRFAAFAGSVSMSATLHPFRFYRDRCGLPPERVESFVADPIFPAENRLVVAVPGVSTAWKNRERDRAAVTEVVQHCIEATPGNIAVYFSSFQQLEDVYTGLDLRGRVVLRQAPVMQEEERQRLLAALAEPLPVARVLLAVLGGIFAEGVDLPGSLSSVIIVGPSLPPPGLDRKLLSQWYETRFGDGFEYAYVQPGMTRVVQAAGRTIRNATDRGAVVLLCQRFLQHIYADFLPKDWLVQRSRKPWELLGPFFDARPVEAPLQPVRARPKKRASRGKANQIGLFGGGGGERDS